MSNIFHSERALWKFVHGVRRSLEDVPESPPISTTYSAGEDRVVMKTLSIPGMSSCFAITVTITLSPIESGP
ncbi:hypothetical protein LCGC14_3060240 [marine sediment metagenome]|uniref:Uncharacterized protein n=1 Tax=marine sediment metagenome TaxID=412755 RepID=A0A0F8WJ35_9ZZZZ